MKVARRAVLALGLLLTLGLALSSVGARGWVQVAHAVAPTPTPTLPNLLGTPTPSPSPTPKQEERKEEREERKGAEEADERQRKESRRDKRLDRDGRRRKGEEARDRLRRKRKARRGEIILPTTPRIPGAYSTDRLLAVAAHLRALGWSEKAVVESVFPPFIIAGYATWVDTWGAPRYGPGPLVRTHQGQDVFCDYGDPVLAAEAGRVEFAEGGLGGIVARLHRGDGSYWYYAHLSGWNTEEFASGDQVQPGDVIGYCGTSGNAATTPPHVHFGWYGNGGLVARDPMRTLIDWLRVAEARAESLVKNVSGERIRNIDRLRLARRFGDSFAPDRSEFVVPGESLWAAGSTPATGAFVVARGALQEAMTASLTPITSPTAGASSAETDAASPNVSMSPALAELLSASWPWATEVAD